LPGVLGVMKAHLESEASGELVKEEGRKGGREGRERDEYKRIRREKREW